jgi:hypothetical protein
LTTRPGGVGTLTSFDAVRGACHAAVQDPVDRIERQHQAMRQWVDAGLLGAEWGSWLDGER